MIDLVKPVKAWGKWDPFKVWVLTSPDRKVLYIGTAGEKKRAVASTWEESLKRGCHITRILITELKPAKRGKRGKKK